MRFVRTYAKRVLKKNLEEAEKIIHRQVTKKNPKFFKPIEISKKKKDEKQPILYKDLNFDQFFFSQLDQKYKVTIEELVEEIKKHKPLDLLVLNMKGKIRYAEYIIFATGISSRHMKGIAKR